MEIKPKKKQKDSDVMFCTEYCPKIYLDLALQGLKLTFRFRRPDSGADVNRQAYWLAETVIEVAINTVNQPRCQDNDDIV